MRPPLRGAQENPFANVETEEPMYRALKHYPLAAAAATAACGDRAPRMSAAVATSGVVAGNCLEHAPVPAGIRADALRNGGTGVHPAKPLLCRPRRGHGSASPPWKPARARRRES